MDGKITSWVSSGSNIFIHNSQNLLCMLALFAPLKEISEDGNRGGFRENARLTAEQGWTVRNSEAGLRLLADGRTEVQCPRPEASDCGGSSVTLVLGPDSL